MSVDIAATSIFVLVTTFTPGPNNILSASMGALHGYRRTAPFLLGVASGFLAILVVCATLSSFVTTHLPAVAPFLRIAGSLYILWLAVTVYRSSRTLLEGPHAAEPLRFWNGWTLQFVNPKGIFFGLTIYSVFLAPALGQSAAVVWSPFLLATVCFTAVSTWALGGHLIRRWVSTPRRARVLGIVLAGALVYTAIDIAGVVR
jgi:cysteine/O-acetylserine efflux protein